MFGKEYAGHLDILTQSFADINNQYEKKIKTNVYKNVFIEKLKKIYILLFGIPEIGFQIRSMYFEKIISSHLSNKNLKIILDAGSGIGAYTFWLGKKFPSAEIIGGDIDEHKLQSARIMSNELRTDNVKFINLDITNIKNKTTYDLIIGIDVLEHVGNFPAVLRNLYDTLNKGGYLYVHVPQPNQERIFSLLKNWHHKDHVREGISKIDLERNLKNLNFKIIVSKKTFGFFGKLAWEINHLTLSRSFIFAGIVFPFIFLLAMLDPVWKNRNGLGIVMLVQKK
jgi:2-polyprenyl-3-methyl-5-hydroxy-6-metoxy-1,4-benzoquinol methylase